MIKISIKAISNGEKFFICCHKFIFIVTNKKYTSVFFLDYIQFRLYNPLFLMHFLRSFQ